VLTPAQPSKIWIGFFLFFALVGFTDATYLTINHFRSTIPACTIVHGCGEVAQSKYSIFFGIPVALLGMIFYIFLIFLLVGYIDTKKRILVGLVSLATFFGFLFSIYLFLLQLLVIKAFCIYCIISGINSTILFSFSIYLQFKKRPELKNSGSKNIKI